MSPFQKLKILNQCRITPSESSSPNRSATIPLTYFDIVFLSFPPVQRLFFYAFPKTRSDFIESDILNMKRSLSLALARFYPLAGSLAFFESGKPPAIVCSDSDSVLFIVAVSSDDLCELAADHVRAAERFRPLLPPLPPAALLSVQVTLFPKSGISVGTSIHHAAGDGSSYAHFMKTWSLIAMIGQEEALSILPPPIFDRSFIPDITGLESTFLKDMADLQSGKILQDWDLSRRSDLARATFVLRPADLTWLARRTSARCSPYALACGLTWACLARARGDARAKTERFGFVTGCRARMRPAVPSPYFGNCLGICGVEMNREELAGDRGAATAAEAIWEVIRGLEKDVFEGRERWVRMVGEYAQGKALTVAGSPKLGIYGVDFGWGRPEKVELVSAERTGAMAMAESRDLDGGIEVGIVLPLQEMEEFISCFVDELSEGL